MDTPQHESLQEFFRRAREDMEEIFSEARKSIDESFEEAKKNIGDAYDSDSTTWDDDSETDDKSSENLDISEELEDGPLLDADNTGNQYPKIDWNAIVGMGLIFIHGIMGRGLRNNFPSGRPKIMSRGPVDHTKKMSRVE